MFGGMGGMGGNQGGTEQDQMAAHQNEARVAAAIFPWQSNNKKNPRKENLWDMLRFAFCAQSKILSLHLPKVIKYGWIIKTNNRTINKR